jgi:putative toxin-antitoxin system antitoxin component (TIGR02293 family)
MALLGLPTSENGMRAHAFIRAGFPVNAAISFKKTYDLSDRELARLLGVQSRTIQRRRKGNAPLDAVQSDRLFRVATVVARVERVVGSRERAKKWLRRSNQALGGETPESLLDTEAGTRQVLDTLGRIEHGIFA